MDWIPVGRPEVLVTVRDIDVLSPVCQAPKSRVAGLNESAAA